MTIALTVLAAALVVAALHRRWSHWWGREAAYWGDIQARLATHPDTSWAYLEAATWCRDNPQPWWRCLNGWVNPQLRYRAHQRAQADTPVRITVTTDGRPASETRDRIKALLRDRREARR